MRRSVAAIAAVSIALTACGSDDDTDSGDDTEQDDTEAGVTIADPWSREPADGQTTSAVYGVVTNNTDETVTAVAASIDVSDNVELHEVVMNDEGQMSMREKEGGYEIGPGETLTFEPGGPHIMVLGIDPAAYPESVDVTLSFDNDTSLDFTAEVREIGGDAMGDIDMDEGSMDEMEDSDG